MKLSLYSIIFKDKFIDHPVLGEITCSAYLEAFKRCSELLDSTNKLNIQCYSLYQICNQCYISNQEKEFEDWIDGQVKERQDLVKFLEENGSTIPFLQQKNMKYNSFFALASNSQQQKRETSDQEKIKNFYKQEFANNKIFFGNNSK